MALHLPVCGKTVPRRDRAGGEGVQRPPQHLLLHQVRHGRQSEHLDVIKQAASSRCRGSADEGAPWLEHERACMSLTYALVAQIVSVRGSAEGSTLC